MKSSVGKSISITIKPGVQVPPHIDRLFKSIMPKYWGALAPLPPLLWTSHSHNGSISTRSSMPLILAWAMVYFRKNIWLLRMVHLWKFFHILDHSMVLKIDTNCWNTYCLWDHLPWFTILMPHVREDDLWVKSFIVTVILMFMVLLLVTCGHFLISPMLNGKNDMMGVVGYIIPSVILLWLARQGQFTKVRNNGSNMFVGFKKYLEFELNLLCFSMFIIYSIFSFYDILVAYILQVDMS